MLVNGVQQSDIKKVSFKGIQKSKDAQGFDAYELFLPHDQSKFTASVELVKVIKKDGEWMPAPNTNTIAVPMNGQKIVVDPAENFLDDESFAYRFKLTQKLTEKEINDGVQPKVIYHTDNGLKISNQSLSDANKAQIDETNNNQYVIVHRNRIPGRMPGTMVHLMPDNYNPGYEINKKGELVAIANGRSEKLLNAKRNHFNLYGGNIAGIIKRLDEMKKMGFDRILSTPLFGRDELSNHGYWTTNPYQVTQKCGTKEDFKKLNVELFKRGMSLVADGAFVNEGLEGIHFRHVLKWGEKSPFKHWFKGEGYKNLGILPNADPHSKAGKDLYTHLKVRVVNGNHSYNYTANSIDRVSSQRDKSQRTFIQVYDGRLVTDEQLKKNEVFNKYGKLETGNHYDINLHNDSVVPVAIEIPEDELAGFEARMEQNKGKYKDGHHFDFLQSVLKFSNFQVGVKEPGNFNTWDGNMDVVKLNFTYTNKDEQDMNLKGATKAEKEEYLQATYQVQDYVQKVGSYWTREVKNADVEHAAKTLSETKDKSVAGYRKLLNESTNLPPAAKDVMSDEIIKNVLSDDYHIPQLQETAVPADRLIEDMMSYPLEAIEFSDDLTSVLGTAYLSKRAHTPEDISKTRNQFRKENDYNSFPDDICDVYYDMDELYSSTLVPAAEKAIEGANKDNTLGLINKEDGMLTDKGKLALPLMSSDITKFLIVKALAPDVKVTNNNGELQYDNEALRKVGLKNLGKDKKGITARTPEEEANKVFQLLKKGLSEIKDEDKKILSDSIRDRFQNANVNDLKLAHVMVDKTESGLNWRTDATKDTLEIDNLRNGLDSFGTEWEEGIKFWKGFVREVHKENPNSLIVTEMTDLQEDQLAGIGSGRFKDDVHATNKFVEETGATTISNYSYFFSSLTEMVSRSAENGKKEGGRVWKISSGMSGIGDGDWGGKNPGQNNNFSVEGSRHSHNFVSNHDKPRMMHILALDMGIFHDNDDAREDIEAAEALYAPNDKKKDMKKQNLAADRKALAMAKAIHENIKPALAEVGIQDSKAEGQLLGAIQDLTLGKFKGKTFNPEHFGTAPIDVAIKDVILQARESHGLSLSDDKAKKLADKTFENTTKEAMKKSHIIDKFLMVLPGDPTFYAGDELAASGYESKCKNIHVQNRNVLHWEWLDDPDKKFIRDFHDEKNRIRNIRKQPELSALSNGDAVRLESVYEADTMRNGKFISMLRYNNESQVLVLAHGEGIEQNNRAQGNEFKVKDDLKEKPAEIDHIDLSGQMQNGALVGGLVGGLAVGTMFRDALQEGAQAVLGVVKKGEKYLIKQFDHEAQYKDYVEKGSGEGSKIKLTDHVMVLKKVAFRGRPNPNHIKIQTYLNSKQCLHQEPRYMTVAKA